MKKRLYKIFLLGAGLLLSACAPTMANRGHLLDAEKLAQIKVGTSTREEVASLLGTPTSVASFDENSWLYVGQVTSQTAFWRPEVDAHRSVRITFDEAGVVQKLDDLSESNRAAIDPATGSTPTLGRQNSLLQELFGGIGRPGLPTNRKGPGSI